jgi:hypothetical protein
MTEPLAFGNTVWSLTEHTRQRMQQRGIRPWMIQAAMEWGKLTSAMGVFATA